MSTWRLLHLRDENAPIIIRITTIKVAMTMPARTPAFKCEWPLVFVFELAGVKGDDVDAEGRVLLDRETPDCTIEVEVNDAELLLVDVELPESDSVDSVRKVRSVD